MTDKIADAKCAEWDRYSKDQLRFFGLENADEETRRKAADKVLKMLCVLCASIKLTVNEVE